MPELVELQATCDERGVELVLVALDIAIPRGSVDSAETLEAFLEEHGWGLGSLAYDGDPALLAERFGLQATPLTIAFDPGGDVVDQVVGAAGLARYQSMIRRLQ